MTVRADERERSDRPCSAGPKPPLDVAWFAGEQHLAGLRSKTMLDVVREASL